MKTFDGKEIYTRLWDDVAQPKAVVQLCHGMAEHSQRYDHFARFLNANGYIVFADDHRAHGHTDNGSGDCIGSPALDTVQDLLFFNNWLHEQYPQLPLIFFGHSYGSSLAHRFIQFPSHICACVMTGINMMPHGMYAAMTGVMGLVTRFAPEKTMSLDSMGMNKRFPDQEAPHAWLTRDLDIRRQYEADPYCGHPVSLRFSRSMAKMMSQATHPANLAQVPDNLPIAMFSGAEDAAGGFGKAAKTALEMYRKAGKQATLKLYPGARHEILNETNKKEVYQDILDFLNSVVDG